MSSDALLARKGDDHCDSLTLPVVRKYGALETESEPNHTVRARPMRVGIPGVATLVLAATVGVLFVQGGSRLLSMAYPSLEAPMEYHCCRMHETWYDGEGESIPMVLACGDDPGDGIEDVVFAAFGVEDAVTGTCGDYQYNVSSATTGVVDREMSNGVTARAVDVSVAVSKVRVEGGGVNEPAGSVSCRESGECVRGDIQPQVRRPTEQLRT